MSLVRLRRIDLAVVALAVITVACSPDAGITAPDASAVRAPRGLTGEYHRQRQLGLAVSRHAISLGVTS